MLDTARMNVGGGGPKGQICLSEFHWTGRANFLPLGVKHLRGRARFGGLGGESKVGRGQMTVRQTDGTGPGTTDRY